MRLKRLRDLDRPQINLTLDSTPVQALTGDTVLTALLAGGAGALSPNIFAQEPRAGFCHMAACQDCWVMVEGLGRVRACATQAADGMVVRRL
ncbi:ferredoxin [Azorhizobium oxalatiphilum]|uniref:Ferredoxin n=1 Tax=Azorhizobium oxalatiphilum TaxID=980631 RepID=A0A917CAG3_9HYPH|nr:2Fe-2S iron-sulfur cluster-binding protein [Azorhizobium oxalatiphilum]GGF81976.1 ferredoxin [Azorhizobium oxalatiphilum]